MKVRLSLEGWTIEHWTGGRKEEGWVEMGYYTRLEEVKEAVLKFEQRVLGIGG